MVIQFINSQEPLELSVPAQFQKNHQAFKKRVGYNIDL